jgi:hypothetical protein
MMDLWTLLVETIFGGFWLSVIGMLIIMILIMTFGSLSIVSIIFFTLLFLIAMAFGYGYPIIIIPIFMLASYYLVSQWIGWMERSGGN